MIMIIAIIYIFLSYVIFDQQLKITFRKSSGLPHTHTHLKKSTPLLLLSITLKIQKLLVPPFCQNFLGNQLKESANRRCVCPN